VPDIVRSIEAERVMALRQQSQLLWHMYFSSIDRIIFTTLEIVRQRIHQHLWKDGRVWNSFPGGLVTLPDYTDTPSRLPWNQQQSTSMTLATGGQRNKNASQFTAVIYSQQQAGSPLVPATSSGPLLHLLRVVSRSQHVARIVVVWASDSPKPPPSRWPSLTRGIPLHIVVPQQKQNIGERFRPLDLIETDAVFSLDEDATLTTDEIDFAFHVWRHFPERIVGFPARTHYWDDTKGQWGYTSKWTNEYSMVLTGAAIYHRYYHALYTDWLGPLLHKTVDQSHNCEDILINFLVSHVTRQPPIKVSQRKQYKSSNLSAVTRSVAFFFTCFFIYRALNHAHFPNAHVFLFGFFF
ncbi:Exostosin-1, partial [Daphnia magna]